MTSGVWPALWGDSTTLGSARTASSGFSGSSWKTSRPAPAMRPLLERVQQRLALDERAAAGVDQDRGLLHEAELATRQEAARLRREPQVQARRSRPARRISSLGRAGRRAADARLVAARAPGQHLHAERLGQRDHARADGAGAEHAERLAQALHQHLARPRAAAHLAVDLGILRPTVSMSAMACSATAKALTPGVLHTVTPAAAGRVQVDVVGAGAPHRDHLEVAAGGEDAVGEAGVGADVDGHAGAADALDELGLVVGAAGGDDARSRRACATRSWAARALEHAREIVGDGDEGVGHGAQTAVREGGLGGGDAGARLGLVAEITQGQLQRRQRRQHVLRTGRDAHGADAQRARPDLVEPGADQRCRSGRASRATTAAGSMPLGDLIDDTVFDGSRRRGTSPAPWRPRRRAARRPPPHDGGTDARGPPRESAGPPRAWPR